MEAAALIVALKAGDESAQQRFWEERWAGVYAICASILGPGPQAAEVAQDALTDFIFDAVHRLQRPEAGQAYLKLMAARRARRRSASIRTRLAGDAELDSLADGRIEGGPEAAAGLALLRPKLVECLGLLRPKARRVMQLKYGAEMANERIGELVGGSKQYIGRLIKDSLARLRECLEGETEVARGET